MSRIRFLYVTLVCMIVLTLGCETTHFSDQTDDFSYARQRQEKGQWGQAILYYRNYLRDNPTGPHAEEASFRLGENYFLMGESSLATIHLRDYIRHYPNGFHRDQAETYLAEAAKDIQPDSSLASGKADSQQEIEKLESLVENKPDDVDLRIQLANAYIKVGAFILAQKALNIAEQDATKYNQTQEIAKNRKKINEALQVRPMHATDLYGNPGPLRISKDQGQLRTQGQAIDRRQRFFYVVAGQIDNSGGQRYNSVEVQVDLYDFFENLLASKTQSIGVIPAWGQRSFSVDISLDMPADTKVSRYQCSLIY